MTILSVIITIIILAISMGFHESAHAFAAKALGDDTAENEGRLSINPIDHIDFQSTIMLPLVLYILNAPIFAAAKPIPVNRHKIRWGDFGMAVVAFAGPLVNILLAIIGVILYKSFMTGEYVGSIIFAFVSVNINLFVFNLIPIPPLDGSKIIYFIAPDFVRSIISNIEESGYGVIIFIALILPMGRLVGNVSNFVINFLFGFFS